MLLPKIHSEVAEHLILEAEEKGSQQLYQIVFLVPEEDLGRSDEIAFAVRTFFAERAKLAEHALREKIRVGGKALLLSVLVVAALFVLVEWMQAFGQGHLYRLFGESLIIIAWVTMWIPAETLLIEPFPLRARRKLLLALACAEVLVEKNPNN